MCHSAEYGKEWNKVSLHRCSAGAFGRGFRPRKPDHGELAKRGAPATRAPRVNGQRLAAVRRRRHYRRNSRGGQEPATVVPGLYMRPFISSRSFAIRSSTARHRSLEDKPANRFGAGRLRLWLRGDPSIDPHQHRALEANANQRPLSCCRRTSLLFPWYGVTHVTVLTRFLSGREEA